MKKTIYIRVTDRFEDFHKYDEAPDEVDFLRLLHRHLFYVNVCIQVNEDDREIEFFMFKKQLAIFISHLMNDLELGGHKMSCEMMADYLAKKIMEKYPQRNLSVEVSEDGENSGIVEYRQ